MKFRSCARDTRVQLLERLLLVLELRRFDTCQTRHAEFASIRSDLNLAGQREHVGREARGEEQGGVVLARDGMGVAFLEHVREIGQAVGEQVDGDGVNRDFHWLSPRGGVDYRAPILIIRNPGAPAPRVKQ